MNFFFFKVNNMKYLHPHLPFVQHISVSTLVEQLKKNTNYYSPNRCFVANAESVNSTESFIVLFHG
jgi:hypothetical protein